MLEKEKRQRDLEYMLWIKTLPCLKTGHYGCDACHYSSYSTGAGKGKKAHDKYTYPMTHEEHMRAGNTGEKTFFNGKREKVRELCEALYKVRGDDLMAVCLLNHYRREIWGGQ